MIKYIYIYYNMYDYTYIYDQLWGKWHQLTAVRFTMVDLSQFLRTWNKWNYFDGFVRESGTQFHLLVYHFFHIKMATQTNIGYRRPYSIHSFIVMFPIQGPLLF